MSVEPMAAVTAPVRVAAQHQSLLHFVGNAPWSDERVLARVRELVLPSIEREESDWLVDMLNGTGADRGLDCRTGIAAPTDQRPARRQWGMRRWLRWVLGRRR